MPARRVTLIRAPSSYRYNCLDVKEESILTLARSLPIGDTAADWPVLDLHLQRELTLDDVIATRATDYVIAVRETGNNPHYALRIAKALARESSARTWLYGQTARLRHLSLPPSARVLPHDEAGLLREITGSDTLKDLSWTPRARPYAFGLPLAPWQKARFKGAIETSRGCPFPCGFCFVNAGDNYAGKKWQVRQTSHILSDLKEYCARGTSHFVFHDSEFLGGAPSDMHARQVLLGAILSDLPPIRFKAYARADTLLLFRDLDLMKEAGLTSVFIGVESLFQPDLDALNKRLRVDDVLACIDRLRRLEIYMDLSFILFNHNSTVASIEHNIRILSELWQGGSRYLGMPLFSFSFESPWQPRAARPVSPRTYLGWDLAMKEPASPGAVFSPHLEPLAEVYRLLNYEWSKKLVEVNMASDGASPAEDASLNTWIDGLGAFCLATMAHFLEDLKRRRLRLDTLPEARTQLFQMISAYYRCLPPSLQHLATLESHAAKLDYSAGTALEEPDEYWERAIPLGSWSTDARAMTQAQGY